MNLKMALKTGIFRLSHYFLLAAVSVTACGKTNDQPQTSSGAGELVTAAAPDAMTCEGNTAHFCVFAGVLHQSVSAQVVFESEKGGSVTDMALSFQPAEGSVQSNPADWSYVCQQVAGPLPCTIFYSPENPTAGVGKVLVHYTYVDSTGRLVSGSRPIELEHAAINVLETQPVPLSLPAVAKSPSTFFTMAFQQGVFAWGADRQNLVVNQRTFTTPELYLDAYLVPGGHILVQQTGLSAANGAASSHQNHFLYNRFKAALQAPFPDTWTAATVLGQSPTHVKTLYAMQPNCDIYALDSNLKVSAKPILTLKNTSTCENTRLFADNTKPILYAVHQNGLACAASLAPGYENQICVDIGGLSDRKYVPPLFVESAADDGVIFLKQTVIRNNQNTVIIKGYRTVVDAAKKTIALEATGFSFQVKNSSFATMKYSKNNGVLYSLIKAWEGPYPSSLNIVKISNSTLVVPPIAFGSVSKPFLTPTGDVLLLGALSSAPKQFALFGYKSTGVPLFISPQGHNIQLPYATVPELVSIDDITGNLVFPVFDARGGAVTYNMRLGGLR